MEELAGSPEEEQKQILSTVSHWLHRIGSANDAEDHGYLEAAYQMRREACAALQELLEEHPFLAGTLPDLGRELETGHLLGYGWSALLDRIKEHLE